MKKKVQSTQDSQPMSPNKSFDPSSKASKTSSKSESLDKDQDINKLILRDHRPLKSLIETLKDPEIERSEKADDYEEFVSLLVTHAKAEEQSLYVAMKDYEALKVESFEGDTGHAIAEQLIQEINACPDDNEWLAKVKVLAELVEHHIQEEEEVILKSVEQEIESKVRQGIGAEYTMLLGEYKSLGFRQPPKKVKFSEGSRKALN